VEVQEPALLGHEESLISFRRQLGHLTEGPILGIVVRILGPAPAQLLEVAQAPLGDAKGFMGRITQIGSLEFPFEMFGFVTDDQFLMARNAELDPHHGRNCAGAVLRALVDANPAGNQPAVDFLQFGDTCANKVLRPFRAFDIVERDLKGDLHGSLRAIKQHFFTNA
jgi:hypothetical protein